MCVCVCVCVCVRVCVCVCVCVYTFLIYLYMFVFFVLFLGNITETASEAFSELDLAIKSVGRSNGPNRGESPKSSHLVGNRVKCVSIYPCCCQTIKHEIPAFKNQQSLFFPLLPMANKTPFSHSHN